ncbi:M56 family metallopeptidase [Puia dinghuensis]|uniref:Peptidase M56 domain-containing protein n=1 Tax=Puia dinghuensis TaxID=1792502 RepID=A0A8J2U8V9_9BACT|nr:M56 family metallopeptidase [Puia dinghuensis]GGA87219.1 hypothetical protein GCM10011511_07950 [Puia dinghuensis]
MHLLTQSALLKALGWTLLNSLWQMGLLWLSYQLLIRIFSQAPSRFRHGLALALLAFGALGSTVTFIDAYFFNDGGWVISGGGYRLAGASRWLVDVGLSSCSSLYLLVLGGLLIRYSHQYIHSRRLTRNGLSKMPAEFRVFVAATSRRMGIHSLVHVYLSALVDVPVTMGFLKPVILLPVAMICHLSPQQVEAILVHELAHIRRKDYLLNLGVTVIGLLFFFNPFTRMLIRDLQREREHCCDDEVLQFNYDPHAYVSALLSLARQHRHGRLALAATGAGDEQLLLQRARRILQQKRTNRRPGARPFILFFLTATITILSLARTGRNDNRPQPTATPINSAVAPVATASSPVAPVSVELALAPIVNTSVPAPHLHSPAAPRHEAPHSHPAKRQLVQASDQDLAEAALLGSVASTNGTPAAKTFVFTQPVTLTITGPDAATSWDYSSDKPKTDHRDQEEADDLPPAEGLVFVPNSSFSFKSIDTLSPKDRLTWIEESTEKEIRAQVVQLQRELIAQLSQLRRQEAQARALSSSSQQQLKQLLNQQLLLQRDYLKRLDELHLRLKKTVRHLTTVYI